jgi:hypothetical protein
MVDGWSTGFHSRSSYGLPEHALERSRVTPEQITREHHEVTDFVVCD